MSEISIDPLSELLVLIQINRSGEITSSVNNFPFYSLFANTNMADCRIILSNMYGYFEPRTTRPGSLVVSLSDFGTRGPGSTPGWAPTIH